MTEHASCGLHADCVTGRRRTNDEQAEYDRRAGRQPSQTIGEHQRLESAVETLLQAHLQGVLTDEHRARIQAVIQGSA